jgi:hypothetical protein
VYEIVKEVGSMGQMTVAAKGYDVVTESYILAVVPPVQVLPQVTVPVVLGQVQ